jgi:hypothetical protein
LYPPFELEKRNAQSRTDGYWKYVSRGEEPPKEVSAAPTVDSSIFILIKRPY